MAYFKDLSNKIVYILNLIKSDQDLCKLLYYSEENPLEQPDITDTQELMFRNLFPLPKNPESIKEQRALLNVYFLDSQNYKINKGFRYIYLAFDIMCHLEVWMIFDGVDSAIRPYYISNKIDEIFNNTVIEQVSDAAIFFEEWKPVRFSDYYYGYRLIYKISESSDIGCN